MPGKVVGKNVNLTQTRELSGNRCELTLRGAPLFLLSRLMQKKAREETSLRARWLLNSFCKAFFSRAFSFASRSANCESSLQRGNDCGRDVGQQRRGSVVQVPRPDHQLVVFSVVLSSSPQSRWSKKACLQLQPTGLTSARIFNHVMRLTYYICVTAWFLAGNCT